MLQLLDYDETVWNARTGCLKIENLLNHYSKLFENTWVFQKMSDIWFCLFGHDELHPELNDMVNTLNVHHNYDQCQSKWYIFNYTIQVHQVLRHFSYS